MNNDLPVPPAPGVAPAPASDRRGVAMLTALFGIVVLAVIIGGASSTSNQEFRATRNALVEQRAFAVAEFGLSSEISNWDRSRNLPNGMAVGAIDSNQVYVAAGDTARVKVTRLTDNSFLVVSEGQANIGNAKLSARRLTSAYVRIAYPSINPKGAITAAGDVKLNGNAHVSGYNTDPLGWNQCTQIPGSTVPAIVVPPSATVTSGPANIISTPAVEYDPAAADSNTYVRYGSESWNSLVANADLKFPGGTLGNDIYPSGTATSCNYSDKYNWGEPNRPGTFAACYGYFPIIYVAGDLKLTGKGRGQGILLVNGNLQINGTFDFSGVIVVRDDIDKGNGTAKIQGAVYAANSVLGDPTWITGTQDVLYSKCAVESALRGSAILTAVKERGWAQLF